MTANLQLLSTVSSALKMKKNSAQATQLVREVESILSPGPFLPAVFFQSVHTWVYMYDVLGCAVCVCPCVFMSAACVCTWLWCVYTWLCACMDVCCEYMAICVCVCAHGHGIYVCTDVLYVHE